MSNTHKVTKTKVAQLENSAYGGLKPNSVNVVLTKFGLCGFYVRGPKHRWNRPLRRRQSGNGQRCTGRCAKARATTQGKAHFFTAAPVFETRR
jgi:hypothetical protein